MEGEFAGHGLEWTVDEILARASGSEVLKAVKEIWEGIVGRGGVALELYPDDEVDDEGEKLVCPPITSSNDEHILNLNHNGQISLNIWIALFLLSHPSRSSPDQLESDIVNSVTALEIANISPQPTLNAGYIATCRQAVSLLRSRQAAMYRPELSIGELLDRRDVRRSCLVSIVVEADDVGATQ
jgi:hypothetical protein